jgi:transcriptional regulator with XRE-family HTH domain
MSTEVINPNLVDKLKSKKYRDLFVASHINKLIPFQIRALRAARNNMTQEELATRADTTQSVISRIQNKGAGNLNIKSLLKLASAFDVALVVRFEPIDRFIDWVDDLSPEVMSPESSETILAEVERNTLAQDVRDAVPARTENAAHGFRALEPTTTAAVQRTLTFGVPREVVNNDLAKNTTSDRQIAPVATTATYKTA